MYIPTSDDITEILRNAIIEGQFSPNERLVEDNLASKFNTSRTPIREAIRNLAAVGLVKVVPNKGAVVAEINIDDAKEVYQVRSHLEGLASKLATNNIPEEKYSELEEMLSKMDTAIYYGNRLDFERWNTNFHMTIYSYSNNSVLCNVIKDLLDKSILFRRSSWLTPHKVENIMKTHRDLLEAIKERDPDRAEKITQDHIVLTATETRIHNLV